MLRLPFRGSSSHEEGKMFGGHSTPSRTLSGVTDYLYDPDLTPNPCNPPPLQLSLVSTSPPPCKVQSEAESTPCEVQSLGKDSLKHVAFLFRALVLQPAEARLTTRILCPWRAYSWRLTALTTGKTLTLSRGC